MRDRGITLPAVGLTNDAEVWIGNDQPLGVIYLRDEIGRPRNASSISSSVPVYRSHCLRATRDRQRWWQSK